jgi:hypothetical protein
VIYAFQRIDRLASAGMTLLARRIADTHRPDQRGTKTAAKDLARTAGTTTGAAKDAVDTSARLPDQPGVDGALRRGELSAAQAAAISSAVAANPAEEHRLVALAGQVSLTELREECARVRTAADPDPEATNRRPHRERRLRRWIDGEGFWNLHAKGTPQAGAASNAAIQPIIDQRFKDAHRAGRREPVEAYAFDALIHLAEHATGPREPDGAEEGGAGDLAAAADTPAGIPGTFDPAGGASARQCGVRPKQRVNPRYLALLRVDVEELRRGQVTGGEMCEIVGVGPVPVSVARAVLGEQPEPDRV